MARKPATTVSKIAATPAKKAVPAARTEVRNTPVPRTAAAPKITAAPAPRAITREMIEQRAYFIWQSGQGGSDLDNWCRAERELRG
ncbi:MAG TPA: DUF2934 domain-containing protein [Tepidisphaeraceae bacterium]|jgi:cell division protein FtsN